MAANPVLDATIQTKLKAVIRTTASLASTWTQLVTDANADAYREVRRRLVGRGFTIAQIESWESYEEYIRDLAVYKALTEAGLYSFENQEHVELRKKRATLDECVLLDTTGTLIEQANDYTVDADDLTFSEANSLFNFSGLNEGDNQILHW